MSESLLDAHHLASALWHPEGMNQAHTPPATKPEDAFPLMLGWRGASNVHHRLGTRPAGPGGALIHLAASEQNLWLADVNDLATWRTFWGSPEAGSISGEVRRIEGGYALNAELVYSGELECSRCLASYPFREDEAFSLVLYPRSSAPAAEVELARGDLDVLFYADPVVPLSPIAEERVQMALPMKPLCKPDCRGLCPTCQQWPRRCLASSQLPGMALSLPRKRLT